MNEDGEKREPVELTEAAVRKGGVNRPPTEERPNFPGGQGMPAQQQASLPIALFDLDGTLADYEGSMIRDLNLLRSPNEPEIERIHGDGDNPDWLENRMFLIKNQPGWWENLEVLKPGLELFMLCHNLGFTNHILTKGPSRTHSAWSQKLLWCRQWLSKIQPNTNVTITEDKSLVYGRVLVDDYPDYMLAWLKHRPRGLGVMPLNQYNEGFQHPNVIHYTGENYEQVKQALLSACQRQDGEKVAIA